MTVYFGGSGGDPLPFIVVCASCHSKQQCYNITQHTKEAEGTCQDCRERKPTYKCTGFKVGIT